MRRIIRSFRTRQNTERLDANSAELVRQLSQQVIRETQSLLKDLQEQFLKDTTGQLGQLTSSSGSSGSKKSGGVAGAVEGSDDFFGLTDSQFNSAGNLLVTGLKYVFSRPKTDTNTVESSRSADVQSSFRVSQAQAAAEMQALLAKGEKNR